MVLSSEWLCVTSHFSLAKCLSSKSKCLPSFYPNQAPWSSCLGGSIWDAFTVDKIIQLQDFLLEFYKEEQLLSLLLLVFQETKLSLGKKKNQEICRCFILGSKTPVSSRQQKPLLLLFLAPVAVMKRFKNSSLWPLSLLFSFLECSL